MPRNCPPLSRREFIERTALCAGGVLLPLVLRAESGAPVRGGQSLRKDVSTGDLDASLKQRSIAARRRFARVAAFINRSHLALREKTIASAEEAMRGLLLLPGSSELSSVGIPPDWLTMQHNDEEFIWSLNRMMHWKTLLQAHALTGDGRYAEKVAAELDDWIKRTQPPSLYRPDGTPNREIGTNAGPPPWRALEVGIRMFDSWPVVIEQLAGTLYLPAERLEHLIGSVAQHGREISLLSPLLWPEADHNHYFMEMLGLLAISVYFPELSAAPDWANQSMRELKRCVDKQFTADGGHIEACPSYHNVCVVLLARYIELAMAGNQPLPATIRNLVARSADQTLHSVRPTGDIVPWGDSTRSNQVEAALWAYRVTNDIGVLQHLTGFMGLERVQAHCAPHLWDIEDPEKLFSTLAQKPTNPRAFVRFDRGNDQVMTRSSWEKEAFSIFFSCHSPLVAGSGHQHIDLGGFDFTAFGRALVVDPGVFTYRESAERKLFKSAEYHNVLTIDGNGPFQYLSRWLYSPQKEGRVTEVESDGTQTLIHSFHRNYDPVACHRTLVLIENQMVVVIDSIESAAVTATVQIYFHLDSTKVAWDEARRCATTDDDDVKLALYSSDGLRGELLPGKVSEKFDTVHASTRVRFSDRGGLPRRVYATILVPTRAGEKIMPVTALTISDDKRVCQFEHGGRKLSVKYV
jgi:Heparinase II/III N-terminus/Heparinase II/III-like protein